MAGRPRSRPGTLEECWSIYPDTKAQMLPNIYKDVDVLTGGLGQDVEYFRIGGTADAATERGPLRKLIDYAIWDSDVYQDPWPDQVFEKKLKSDVDGLVSRIVEKIQKIHADIDPPTDWLVCWITALVIFWPGGRLALEYKKDDPKESIPPGGSGAKYDIYTPYHGEVPPPPKFHPDEVVLHPSRSGGIKRVLPGFTLDLIQHDFVLIDLDFEDVGNIGKHYGRFHTRDNEIAKIEGRRLVDAKRSGKEISDFRLAKFRAALNLDLESRNLSMSDGDLVYINTTEYKWILDPEQILHVNTQEDFENALFGLFHNPQYNSLNFRFGFQRPQLGDLRSQKSVRSPITPKIVPSPRSLQTQSSTTERSYESLKAADKDRIRWHLRAQWTKGKPSVELVEQELVKYNGDYTLAFKALGGKKSPSPLLNNPLHKKSSRSHPPSHRGSIRTHNSQGSNTSGLREGRSSKRSISPNAAARMQSPDSRLGPGPDVAPKPIKTPAAKIIKKIKKEVGAIAAIGSRKRDVYSDMHFRLDKYDKYFREENIARYVSGGDTAIAAKEKNNDDAAELSEVVMEIQDKEASGAAFYKKIKSGTTINDTLDLPLLDQLGELNERDGLKSRWEECAALFQISAEETGPEQSVRLFGLKRPLYQYQAFAIYHMMKQSRFTHGGFLSDTPGLGKTFTFLAWLVVERQLAVLHEEVRVSRQKNDGRHNQVDKYPFGPACPTQGERPNWIVCPCSQFAITAPLQPKHGARLALVPSNLVTNWKSEWYNCIDMDHQNLLDMRLIVVHAQIKDSRESGWIPANLNRLKANSTGRNSKIPGAVLKGQEGYLVVASKDDFLKWTKEYFLTPNYKSVGGEDRYRPEWNINFGIACWDEFHQNTPIRVEAKDPKGESFKTVVRDVGAAIMQDLPGAPFCWGISGTPLGGNLREPSKVLKAMEMYSDFAWSSRRELTTFTWKKYDELVSTYHLVFPGKDVGQDPARIEKHKQYQAEFLAYFLQFMIRRTSHSKWFGHPLRPFPRRTHQDIILRHDDHCDEMIEHEQRLEQLTVQETLAQLQKEQWDDLAPQDRRMQSRPEVLGFENNIITRAHSMIFASVPHLSRMFDVLTKVHPDVEHSNALKAAMVRRWHKDRKEFSQSPNGHRSNPFFEHLETLVRRSPKLMWIWKYCAFVERRNYDLHRKDVEAKEKKVVILSNYPIVLYVIKLMLESLVCRKRDRVGFVFEARTQAEDKINQDIVDCFNESVWLNDDGRPVRKVKGDMRYLLGVTKIMAEGFQLTRAAKLIMVEPHFDFEKEVQAFARVWRLGQKEPFVETYRLIDHGSTLEMSLIQRQADRSQFHGVRAGADEKPIWGDAPQRLPDDDLSEEEDIGTPRVADSAWTTASSARVVSSGDLRLPPVSPRGTSQSTYLRKPPNSQVTPNSQLSNYSGRPSPRGTGRFRYSQQSSVHSSRDYRHYAQVGNPFPEPLNIRKKRVVSSTPAPSSELPGDRQDLAQERNNGSVVDNSLQKQSSRRSFLSEQSWERDDEESTPGSPSRYAPTQEADEDPAAPYIPVRAGWGDSRKQREQKRRGASDENNEAEGDNVTPRPEHESGRGSWSDERDQRLQNQEEHKDGVHGEYDGEEEPVLDLSYLNNDNDDDGVSEAGTYSTIIPSEAGTFRSNRQSSRLGSSYTAPEPLHSDPMVEESDSEDFESRPVSAISIPASLRSNVTLKEPEMEANAQEFLEKHEKYVQQGIRRRARLEERDQAAREAIRERIYGSESSDQSLEPTEESGGNTPRAPSVQSRQSQHRSESQTSASSHDTVRGASPGGERHDLRENSSRYSDHTPRASETESIKDRRTSQTSDRRAQSIDYGDERHDAYSPRRRSSQTSSQREPRRDKGKGEATYAESSSSRRSGQYGDGYEPSQYDEPRRDKGKGKAPSAESSSGRRSGQYSSGPKPSQYDEHDPGKSEPYRSHERNEHLLKRDMRFEGSSRDDYGYHRDLPPADNPDEKVRPSHEPDLAKRWNADDRPQETPKRKPRPDEARGREKTRPRERPRTYSDAGSEASLQTNITKIPYVKRSDSFERDMQQVAAREALRLAKEEQRLGVKFAKVREVVKIDPRIDPRVVRKPPQASRARVRETPRRVQPPPELERQNFVPERRAPRPPPPPPPPKQKPTSKEEKKSWWNKLGGDKKDEQKKKEKEKPTRLAPEPVKAREGERKRAAKEAAAVEEAAALPDSPSKYVPRGSIERETQSSKAEPRGSSSRQGSSRSHQASSSSRPGPPSTQRKPPNAYAPERTPKGASTSRQPSSGSSQDQSSTHRRPSNTYAPNRGPSTSSSLRRPSNSFLSDRVPRPYSSSTPQTEATARPELSNRYAPGNLRNPHAGPPRRNPPAVPPPINTRADPRRGSTRDRPESDSGSQRPPWVRERDPRDERSSREPEDSRRGSQRSERRMSSSRDQEQPPAETTNERPMSMNPNRLPPLDDDDNMTVFSGVSEMTRI